MTWFEVGFATCFNKTMRNHATGTPESRKLLSELEESWARVSDHKFGVSRAPSVPSIYGQYVAPGGRAASIVSSRRNGGVANMSEFGVSQSYRSQTPSHVHGAAGSINVDPLGVVSPSLVNATAANASAAAAIAGERDTLRSRDGGISGMRGSISGQSFTEFDDTNIAEVEMRNWKQDVTWALETINEEMSAMRQRYLYAPLQGLTGTNIGNAGTNASSSAAGVAGTGHDPALYSQFPPSLSANPLNNSAPPFIDHNYGAPSNSQLIGTRGNGGGAPGSPSPPISALQKSVMTMGYQFAKHLLIDLLFIIFVTRIVKWVRRKPAYLIRHPYMARLLRMAGSSLTFILFKVLKLDIRPM